MTIGAARAARSAIARIARFAHAGRAAAVAVLRACFAEHVASDIRHAGARGAVTNEAGAAFAIDAGVALLLARGRNTDAVETAAGAAFEIAGASRVFIEAEFRPAGARVAVERAAVFSDSAALPFADAVIGNTEGGFAFVSGAALSSGGALFTDGATKGVATNVGGSTRRCARATRAPRPTRWRAVVGARAPRLH